MVLHNNINYIGYIIVLVLVIFLIVAILGILFIPAIREGTHWNKKKHRDKMESNKKRSKRIIIILVISILVISMMLVFSILLDKKVITFNHPSEKNYPVKGVDVSRYQGNIDWEKISSQKIDFAYIKATEGSSYVDKKFLYNWQEAAKTDLKIGAYHFFSFDSSGKTQAENFIKTVKKKDGMLPCVVDIEFYGDKEKHVPDVDSTQKELGVLLTKLEEQYGKMPVIYATMKSYRLYIEDAFDNYPLWIRNVYYSPNIDLKGKWTFWQYTDQGILNGYDGNEKYIDMNVFRGNEKEFQEFSK